MNHADKFLCIALVIYGFIASVLPVWMLRPRGYLSTYMKIGAAAVLAIGVIVMAPGHLNARRDSIRARQRTGYSGQALSLHVHHHRREAVSGFHALIASGTTPKMIVSEKEIPLIGFGSMLTEGFVAVMALIAATVLVPGDYFAINSMAAADKLAAMGFPADKIQSLSAMVGVNVAHRPGGAVSLAVGMSSILSAIPGMKRLMPYWFNFALMFEALFILTTVDTGTRVARFLLQEFGGRIHKPLGDLRWMPGNVAMSAAVVLAWGYLIYTGSVAVIWPMFGVANQLLAAIALGIGTTIIIKAGRVRYAWVTAVPMCFMLVTTLTAAWELMMMFRARAVAANSASGALTFNLDAALVGCMAVLAIVVFTDMTHKWYCWLSTRRAMETSEVIEYAPE